MGSGKQTLYVFGMPAGSSEGELLATLMQSGVESLFRTSPLKTSSRGSSCFIKFDSSDDAQRAMDALSSSPPQINGVTIQVEWAKSDMTSR